MASTKVLDFILGSTGMVFDHAGYQAPSGFLLCYGQAVSRTTYAALFAAITLPLTGGTTSGSKSVSAASVDITALGLIGAKVEGAGVPANTTVTAATSTTLTISANATATAAGVALTIIPWGNGDGSTTFNVPDLRGVVTAGIGNMGGTASGKLSVSTTGTTTAASAVVSAIPSTAGLTAGMQAIGGALPAGVTIASVDSGTQVTLSTGVGVTAATAGAIRFCVIDSHTIGATGGVQTHALAAQQIPQHNHPVFLNDPGHTHSTNAIYFVGGNNISGGSTANLNIQALTSASSTTGITVRDATAGGGTANQTAVNAAGGGAHPNIQPTIVLNKIIKY